MLSVMKAPTKKKQKAAQPELRNHIILVLDRSGSMARIWDTTSKVFDQTVKVIKDAAVAEKQITSLSLITFGGDVRSEFSELAIETVKPFYAYGIHAGGGTPLLAAVSEATQRVLLSPDFKDPNVSFLVKVLTDGEATDYSSNFANTIVGAIQRLSASKRVTFVFEVPVGGRAAVQKNFNREIPEENIQEWETTSEGAERAAVATTRGFQEYFRARSKGLTSTSKFYLDAQNLTKTEIKRAGLKDITATQRVKSYAVGGETEIKPFIEGKTGRPYQIGMAYYQLTKPEKLQARKLFLLKEKGKDPVYAGLDARALLGLPDSGDVKITPGVLGKWDIFVQSTSVNRKLVRGSTVLYLG